MESLLSEFRNAADSPLGSKRGVSSTASSKRGVSSTGNSKAGAPATIGGKRSVVSMAEPPATTTATAMATTTSPWPSSTSASSPYPASHASRRPANHVTRFTPSLSPAPASRFSSTAADLDHRQHRNKHRCDPQHAGNNFYVLERKVGLLNYSYHYIYRISY